MKRDYCLVNFSIENNEVVSFRLPYVEGTFEEMKTIADDILKYDNAYNMLVKDSNKEWTEGMLDENHNILKYNSHDEEKSRIGIIMILPYSDAQLQLEYINKFRKEV